VDERETIATGLALRMTMTAIAATLVRSVSTVSIDGIGWVTTSSPTCR